MSLLLLVVLLSIVLLVLLLLLVSTALLKTVGLAEALRRALEGLADRIEVAFVFGSLARGEAVAESDVDLMVIGEVGLRDLVPAIQSVTGDLGREVNPITLGPSELRERLGRGDPFLARVLQEPRIFVFGGEDELRSIAEAGVSPEA